MLISSSLSLLCTRLRPITWASIFRFIETSQSGQPYANRMHGGSAWTQYATLSEEGRYRQPEGRDMVPRMIPSTEWVTSRTETRACRFYGTFFADLMAITHTRRSSGQTTTTWPREIACVMQDLFPAICYCWSQETWNGILMKILSDISFKIIYISCNFSVFHHFKNLSFLRRVKSYFILWI